MRLSCAAAGKLGGCLERTERAARVAAGALGEKSSCIVVDRKSQRAESAFFVGQRARDQVFQILGRQRFENDEAAAREQGRVDFERRVLGGRAHEHDRPALDVRQERVLLRLVEAVDLVDEKDGAAILELAAVAGASDDLSHLLHPRQDCRHGLELEVGAGGEQAGHGGLTGPGRSPQNARVRRRSAQHSPKKARRRQCGFLADDLADRSRAHPLRQRRVRIDGTIASGIEQGSLASHGSVRSPRIG